MDVDFSFTELSSGDILAELGKLHVWKSYGLDCVSPRLLKECRSELAEPLCYLFNLSLSTGVYPGQGKRSIVSLCTSRREIVRSYRLTAPSLC